MNKSTIITSLLALVAMAGQTKTFKTIKNPEAMACVKVSNGELKVREVIFRDTATTVHFTMEYPKGQGFRFVSSSYLMDENGKRYPLRFAEGIALDAWVQSPESGIIEFTMHFSPLPKRTLVFDFIEGDVPRAFKLLGIHDKKTKLKVPTMQELTEANPWTVPEDWFNTDTITVKGRIEGYNAELFGFTSMECYFEDVFEKSSTTLVLDIADDGTFCKKFQASYPVCQRFYTMESKKGFNEIAFYARPGETIDITVKKIEQGKYVCVYNNGSSRDVERWLRSSNAITDVLLPLVLFEGTFDEENSLADKVWQNVLYRLQTVSRREHYTPMEMQLALADVQSHFAESYMYSAMKREFALMKQEYRDGVYYTEILDSVEWNNLWDAKNYRQLQHIDFDNPLLFASSDYPHLLNRIQYAKPVTDRQYDGIVDEYGGYVNNEQNAKKELSNLPVGLKELMATGHENLMLQMCIYKTMLSNFNGWRNQEDIGFLDNIFSAYLRAFSHPYIHQKAEQFYAHKMEQTELSSPLPEVLMADLIRHLCEKYPGKYLLIDFWGMGCGPCRGAIQESKELRAKIAKRNDVKLIFIAEERTAEGSEAYHKYVDEWLADEVTICLTYDGFARMQELFRFNGIPHYETITPDGRRVRDDLQIQGFYNFDYEMNRLLERLK